jgi:hypothetical protein
MSSAAKNTSQGAVAKPEIHAVTSATATPRRAAKRSLLPSVSAARVSTRTAGFCALSMPCSILRSVNGPFEQFYRVTQLRIRAGRVDSASSEFWALAVAFPPTMQHNARPRAAVPTRSLSGLLRNQMTAAVQEYVVYVAALSANSKNAAAGQAFIKSLTDERASAVLKAKGLEPAAPR